MSMKHTILALLACGLLAACGGDDTGLTTPSSGSTPSAASAKLLLAKDPGEAKSILDVRKLKPGDEVVAVGRVQHIEKGFAALRLIDTSLQWCNTTNTPWDFCCHDKSERDAAILPVEIRRDGDVVESDDPGIRHLDVVVITGKLERTEGGGLVLVGNDGWFRRERPDLGDRVVDWP